MTDQPMAKPACEHFWASYVHGGMSVSLCQFCREPNWQDMRRELAEAERKGAAAERERLGVLPARERDLMLHDLGMLLEALGLGNFARPDSPHDVMLMCVAEAARLKETQDRVRPLVAGWRADAKRMERSHPSACANFRDAANDLEQRLKGEA